MPSIVIKLKRRQSMLKNFISKSKWCGSITLRTNTKYERRGGGSDWKAMREPLPKMFFPRLVKTSPFVTPQWNLIGWNWLMKAKYLIQLKCQSSIYLCHYGSWHSLSIFFLSRSVYLEYHMIGGAHPILMSFSYLLRSKWFKSRFSSFLHFSRFLMIFTWGQHSLFKLYRLFINLSLTLAFHYVDVPILECWNRSNHITWSCRVASCCKVSCREHTQTGGQQFNVVKWNCCEGYAMMKCNQIEFSFLIEFLRSPSSSLLIYSDYSWGKKWRKTSTRNVSRFVHIFSSLVATHSFMQIMSFWFLSTFSNNFIIFPLSYA